MSMFGDYKSYKQFEPQYAQWKNARNIAEVKRNEYLRLNPQEINSDDIQKSKALLRAIDVMDEYSQEKSEDMEIITETVVGQGLEIALSIGTFLGILASKLKPIRSLAGRNKKAQIITTAISGITGAMVGTTAAFPLYAWAAKAEVKASRKGRFQAMREELNNPKSFATLTPEQEQKLAEITTKMPLKEKKSFSKKLNKNWRNIKELATDSNEYLIQKFEFEKNLIQNAQHFDKELTPKEIEDAKRDQQLLTKLIEKIDIASQDYAENAELATSTLVTVTMALSGLVTLAWQGIAKLFKFKPTPIPAIIGVIAMIGTSIISASIQKQASRVGRYKIKQELMKHPEQLVYINDEKTGEIKDVKINTNKKEGMLKFLRNAWKNNKEFESWKKTEGAYEKNITKAMEQLELSDEQIKDAKRLQENTFKTFNKVDEFSQKYAESIEALGQAIQYPIGLLFGMVGVALGSKYLYKISQIKDLKDMTMPFVKYISVIFLSVLPSIGINALITKEQKKASRVANMLAINEMQDYRHFADYSRFKDT